MILERIKQEESYQPSIKPKDKSPSIRKHSFRTTNFTLRKKFTLDLQPQISQQSPAPHTRSPDQKLTYGSSLSPDQVERTCSNFMKNYVEKLKKQRKREKKKLSQMNSCKHSEREAMMGCDIVPLPLIHHGKQQILIFQKITPGSFRSAIIQPVPSSSVIEAGKIEEIMTQIKQHKQKSGRQMKKRLSDGFPSLDSPLKGKRQQKVKTIQHLNPWQNEESHQKQVLFQDFK